MTRVCLNARYQLRPLTGVERFASEVSSRLAEMDGVTLRPVVPDRPLEGIQGHAWEQFALPRALAPDEVLFSPCNTGPISVRSQLVVIHDAAVWDCPDGFSRVFRSVYRRLLPRLAKRAAAIATVSEFSRSRLAEHLRVPEEKIVLLHNAASPDFSPDPERRGSRNSESSDRAPIFLCVGSMDPRKNLGRLLRAWLKLQSEGRLPEGAELQLVGGANPRNFAGVERIEGRGIAWLGRIDDQELVARYRAADAFVYPSLYEGFGLPPLEAMACGCPVLLSHAASLPEVGGKPEDGAALYFDPESESEIAKALERFAQLDTKGRVAMRESALARAEKFTWDAVAKKAAAALGGC